MSGSGVKYYNQELKDLLRLLKHLPDAIPIGDAHNTVGSLSNWADSVGAASRGLRQGEKRGLEPNLGRGDSNTHILMSFPCSIYKHVYKHPVYKQNIKNCL